MEILGAPQGSAPFGARRRQDNTPRPYRTYAEQTGGARVGDSRTSPAQQTEGGATGSPGDTAGGGSTTGEKSVARTWPFASRVTTHGWLSEPSSSPWYIACSAGQQVRSVTNRNNASAAAAVHRCARGDPNKPTAGVRGVRPDRGPVAPPKPVRTCCKTIALIAPNRAGCERIFSARSGGSGRSRPSPRSPPPAGALAIRTDPEELEAVFYLDKAIAAGQCGLDFTEHAAVELDDAIALPAEQVVVLMTRGIIIGDFESGEAVSEVDAVDQAHLLDRKSVV